jgi:hypothetical protein
MICLINILNQSMQVLTRSVYSNISNTAKFGVINNQFYRCLRLCCSKDFFVSQTVNLIVLLKSRLPSKDSVKEN